jgi:uncharacterized protein YueI
MNKEDQSEAISTWVQKEDLEKALIVGMHGAPEFKHDEKVYYLGEFKENVIRLLSKRQVVEAAIYPEIIRALKDKRATKMIIDGSISNRCSEKYKRIAKKMNKPYTMRSDTEFQGTTGLLVISDEAVGIPVKTVENRSIRLKRLGLSSALIRSAGKKVCKRCLNKILKADPNEDMNYRQLTWGERLGGERCPAHVERKAKEYE